MWFATNGQVLLPLTSGAEAVETLVDVCRNVRDGKRTRQTAGPYLCPGGDFSSGQIAACCSLNGFAAAIVTEWGARLVSEVDVNWHPHTLNPPACCLQNVSFSSRAEMQTETLWEITVSESVQGQDFESLQVCFFFFFWWANLNLHAALNLWCMVTVCCVMEGCFLNNFSSATIYHIPHSLTHAW